VLDRVYWDHRKVPRLYESTARRWEIRVCATIPIGIFVAVSLGDEGSLVASVLLVALTLYVLKVRLGDTTAPPYNRLPLLSVPGSVLILLFVHSPFPIPLALDVVTLRNLCSYTSAASASPSHDPGHTRRRNAHRQKHAPRQHQQQQQQQPHVDATHHRYLVIANLITWV
jgi:hypothetical protein